MYVQFACDEPPLQTFNLLNLILCSDIVSCLVIPWYLYPIIVIIIPPGYWYPIIIIINNHQLLFNTMLKFEEGYRKVVVFVIAVANYQVQLQRKEMLPSHLKVTAQALNNL